MSVHLVDCVDCNGDGEVIAFGWDAGDPYAPSVECIICDGTGTVPHDEPYCEACEAIDEANRILEVMPC